MPEPGRVIAAVVGGLLVITAARSVIGTVIVPRPSGSWLTRWVDKIVNGAYLLVTGLIAKRRRQIADYTGQHGAVVAAIVTVAGRLRGHRRRWVDRVSIDQILAGQAAAILMGQLVAWVVIFYVGLLAAAVAVHPRRHRRRVQPGGPGRVRAQRLAGTGASGRSPTSPPSPPSSPSRCRSPTCPPCTRRSTGARPTWRC